ncbi:MAG: hypothetical protein ACLPKZ_03735, partial [Acidimicrobiales bacterium]
MVGHKDVVLGLLGASAALSGLLLVFLGFIIGAVTGFKGDTPAEILNPLKRVAWACLVSFFVGIACIAVCSWWLFKLGEGFCMYPVTIALFAVQLASLL